MPAVSARLITATSIAQFGTAKYDPLPAHFPYADPGAPKGGSVVLGAEGSFDNLNPYTLRGDAPDGIAMTDDTLMTPSADELAVAYPLIASSVQYPADDSFAIFTLNPKARFQDGTPITAANFVAALAAVRQKEGPPFLQTFFESIDHLEAPDDHHLKAVFTTRNTLKPMLNLATALAPLNPGFWAKHDLTKTLLEPTIGSGPYRVASLEPGRSITYTRVKDYWAADLPVMRGLANFDTIRYDYYLDDAVMFEAFKAHKIDFRVENKAQRWATEYDIPAVKDGSMIKRAVDVEMPQGIQGLFFNLRRPQFQDIDVRHALNDLFDFQTLQRTLLNGQYKRTASYFPGSDYGSSGKPTPQEVAILTPFKDQLPPEVLTQAFIPPVTDGSGNNRANIHAALDLLKQAGWQVQDTKLMRDGKPFTIEILLDSQSYVRVTQPLVDTMKRIGIDASIRLVDPAQYENRLKSFDFDMIMLHSNFFPPPGPEMRSYYGSAAADVRGTGNWSGIKNPVADALIEQIVAAKDLDTLKAINRALDRVLLWQYYCIPEWYNDQAWLAYWNGFGYPATKPRYGVGFPDTWWIKP